MKTATVEINQKYEVTVTWRMIHREFMFFKNDFIVKKKGKEGKTQIT